MGNLMRRRAMMAAVSGGGDGPLHPFVDGSYSSGYVKISNGNHVRYQKQWAGANTQMDLSHWTDAPYQLYTGDVIETTVDVTQITSSEIRLMLRDSAGTNRADIMNYVSEPGTYSKTLTLSSDIELSQIRSYWKNGAQKAVFEFDITMYVNGVRWI